jgi:translation initiation factor IF-2
VVTIMGHVDHGKTSLLDKIRKTAVADGEAGGITQHIGAYKVSTAKGDVVFLDTPGHEAFSAMRTRGAQVTDVVVLVVAADDGIMPTTVEAIKHAREANVPIVVAINKIDKPDANPGRVKQMLMEYGLVGEEFGGETIICEVSAKTGKGIDKLLEMLALQTEILDLRATSTGRAQGVVLEARVDKGRGPDRDDPDRGRYAGEGRHRGRQRVQRQGPRRSRRQGQAARASGPPPQWRSLGWMVCRPPVTASTSWRTRRPARQLISHRRETRRRKESVRSGPSIQDFIAAQEDADPQDRACERTCRARPRRSSRRCWTLSTDKVKVEVIFAGVGAITQTDIKMASAGEAVIIGFNTKPVGKTGQIADAENVPIYPFEVIYDALDKVKLLMIDLLEPVYRERELGEAEVRALFPIPRLGVVAGCKVVRGSVLRTGGIRVIRKGQVIHKGGISSLRIFKDDVKEVREGYECGIVVDGFPDVQPGDILQAFDIETIAPTL